MDGSDRLEMSPPSQKPKNLPFSLFSLFLTNGQKRETRKRKRKRKKKKDEDDPKNKEKERRRRIIIIIIRRRRVVCTYSKEPCLSLLLLLRFYDLSCNVRQNPKFENLNYLFHLLIFLQGLYLAYFFCWLFGNGCLFSWNSMLTIEDYYSVIFPVTFCSCLSSIGERESWRIRLWI